MSDHQRLRVMKREWAILRRLAKGATLKELAEEHNCNIKTIQRDLTILQEVGFPIYDDIDVEKRWFKVWRLERNFKFL